MGFTDLNKRRVPDQRVDHLIAAQQQQFTQWRQQMDAYQDQLERYRRDVATVQGQINRPSSPVVIPEPEVRKSDIDRIDNEIRKLARGQDVQDCRIAAVEIAEPLQDPTIGEIRQSVLALYRRLDSLKPQPVLVPVPQAPKRPYLVYACVIWSTFLTLKVLHVI